jgi:hypothetical protein
VGCVFMPLIGLKLEVGETERFDVVQDVGTFSDLDKTVHLFQRIQREVLVENRLAEVTENGRHEGTSAEGIGVLPE